MNHSKRTFDLKRMLTDRRREVRSEIQSRVRGLQTVARIDDALVRLEAGQYGSCIECAREISQHRLSALPFAVRCQACEERREQELGRTQASEQKSRKLAHSLDVVGP
jgi:RNA polymerase-binding transcription factor DksA